MDFYFLFLFLFGDLLEGGKGQQLLPVESSGVSVLYVVKNQETFNYFAAGNETRFRETERN